MTTQKRKEIFDILVKQFSLANIDMHKKTGKSESELSRYRKGTIPVSEPFLIKLAENLQVNLDDYMGYPPINEPNQIMNDDPVTIETPLKMNEKDLLIQTLLENKELNKKILQMKEREIAELKKERLGSPNNN